MILNSFCFNHNLKQKQKQNTISINFFFLPRWRSSWGPQNFRNASVQKRPSVLAKILTSILNLTLVLSLILILILILALKDSISAATICFSETGAENVLLSCIHLGARKYGFFQPRNDSIKKVTIVIYNSNKKVTIVIYNSNNKL